MLKLINRVSLWLAFFLNEVLYNTKTLAAASVSNILTVLVNIVFFTNQTLCSPFLQAAIHT
jgi:hypothetical protein